MRPAGLPSAAELAARHPCGTRVRYVAGCRCAACRQANTTYRNMRNLAALRGETNRLVSARRARSHIIALGRRHVGYRMIADAARISGKTVRDIRSGHKKQLREQTEKRILAVTPHQCSDLTLVSARSTWRQINKLVDEGYTHSTLARMLGRKYPQLKLRKDRVTVRMKHRINRLYKRLTT